jgi:hypothetical protein
MRERTVSTIEVVTEAAVTLVLTLTMTFGTPMPAHPGGISVASDRREHLGVFPAEDDPGEDADVSPVRDLPSIAGTATSIRLTWPHLTNRPS